MKVNSNCQSYATQVFFTLFTSWINCFHSTYRCLNWDTWRLRSKYLLSIWTSLSPYDLYHMKPSGVGQLRWSVLPFSKLRDTRTVNCVRNTAWRRRKQTQNCAAVLASQLALSLSNTWVTETWAASPSAGCVACVSMCSRPKRVVSCSLSFIADKSMWNFWWTSRYRDIF